MVKQQWAVATGSLWARALQVVEVICRLTLALLILGAGSASAQVNFFNPAISATSGTANANGLFTVTFSGNASAQDRLDTVSQILVAEGGSFLGSVDYDVVYDPNVEGYVNTVRPIRNTVALTPGIHTLRLIARTARGSEAASQNFVVTVASNTPVNGATFVSQSVPSSMYAGQTYTVSVTMKNTGTTTWTPGGAKPHTLGSQNPGDNSTWGFGRVALPASVAPGASVTFNFTVTAPASTGTYNFQWGMLQEDVEWFGGASTNVPVTVTTVPSINNATFVSQSVPSSMTAGQAYTVSVTMRNTGNTTWSVGGAKPFGLGSQNPQDNTIWRANRVALSSAVAPGTAATFTFTVTAPSTAGTYNFRWQMVQDSVGWFGPLTTNVPITVAEALPTVTLTSPPNGATYTASGDTATVPLTGSAAGVGGATITRLEFFDGTTSLAYIANSTSISLSKPLAVGQHRIELRATDSRGKAQSAFSTIIVVGAKPTPALTAPLNNSAYVITSGSTAYVTVTGNAGTTQAAKIEVLDGTTVVHSQDGGLFGVTLLLAAGKHPLQMRVTDFAGQVGTSAISNVNVFAGATGDAAGFVSQTMSTALRAGQPVTFSVSMVNTGTTTWSEGASFRLGSQNPQDNRVWGGRVYLTGSVAPGQTGTFTATVTAPQTAGTYNFQWQMVHEDVTWFGAKTDNLSVTVTAGAGPTATLTGTPTNVRVSGTGAAAVTLTGNGSRSGGVVSKLELFQANVTGMYGAAPVKTVTGSTASLAMSAPVNLAAGIHFFKLRSTDSAGLQTESRPVIVNVTNSALLGTIGGVRTNAAGTAELYGWTCQSGSTTPLNYKVLLDAPSLGSGGTELTTGVANVATELDNASVQSQCATPGTAHHFVVNLSTYIAQYAGRRLYVWAETANKALNVSLPCVDNNCTMPGTTRVGITTPTANATYVYPNPAFLKMKLTNYSGTFDEVGFYVNGQWIAAQPDGAAGEYSVQKTGLAVSTTPYTVYAVARQGSTAIQSAVVPFFVSAASTITINTPTAGATLSVGTAQTLQAITSASTPAAVKFFGNGTLLGNAIANGSTWSLNWTPTAAGNVALTAVAYDGTGAQLSQSSAVNVSVTSTTGSATPIPVVLSVPHLGDPDAGTLPGELSVTPTGAASYTIQLAVPPGTAGLQPALSLAYDSSGTNGLLGMGWKLAGMSSINRCGKTIAQDGVNTRISFTTGDRLCLDGQRLVLVNRALSDADYWAAGAEYRTEIDSFVRITAIGDISVRTFRAEGKDKRIMSFGAGSGAVGAFVTAYNGGASPPQPASRQGAQAWALDSIRDRSGNFITFSYTQDGSTGEHRPTMVRYGGNGMRAHAVVEFVYEGRPDAWKRYIDETRNDLRSRISRIRTYVSDDGTTTDAGASSMLAREYTLTYEQSPTSGRSQLTSVGVCARSAASATMECQPATVFSWGKPDKAAGFAEWGTWSGAPALTKHGTTLAEVHPEYFAFADFENHGLTDVLEKRVAPPARGSGAPTKTSVDGLPYGTVRTQYRYFHNTGTGFVAYTYQLNTGAAFAVLDIADFNGDGAPDIVAGGGGGASKVCLSPLAAGLPAGATNPIIFTCTDAYPISGAGNSDDRPAYLVDVVGDGRSGQYSRVEETGVAKLCVLGVCMDDDHAPAVLASEIGNDGRPDYRLANFVGFTQMIDFTGIGKPYDVRFSRPHYTEFMYDDGGATSTYINRWDNLRPTITMTGFNLPIPLGQPAPAVIPGAMAEYTYPTKYPSPVGKAGRPPYIFDEPYAGASLGADFSGSGYSSLAFGFLELGYTAEGKIAYNRSDMTVCLSTGRGLDCGVRQKYSGANYKAMVNIADFVGDGAPSMLVQAVTFDAQRVATKTDQLEVCRVKGDDTTGGAGTDDGNMSCEQWPGAALRIGGAAAYTDRAFFMDLLGTGRMQLVYYHGGTFVNGQWQEDGRWTVYQPIDRAPAGQALDRIHAVTNGVGTVSSVEYVDGLAGGIVTRTGDTDLAASYPRHVALRTGKIVKTLRSGNGGALRRTKTYTYADPAIDVAGRGSLGFGSVTETDADTGVVTRTRYSHNWPYNGMARGVQVSAGGVVLSDTVNVLSTKNLPHGTGGTTQLPYIGHSTVVRKDLDGSALGTITTVSRYDDDYGNVTSEDVSTSAAGKTFVTRTVTSYLNNATNWLIGQPDTITVTKTDPEFVNAENGSHDVVRTVRNVYDTTTGLLSATITEPGAAQYQVQTDFIRTGNSFGLVSEKKQTWNDMQAGKTATRSQTMVYDTRGRYPETMTNAAGHAENVAYDPLSGARTSSRDANGQLTAWTVNGFGRITLQRNPDGNEIRSYVKRCAGACRNAALVQITERYFGGSRTAVPTLVYTDDMGHVLSTQTFDFAGQPTFADQTYDALGRLERVYQPAYEGAAAKLASRQEYDILGRVKKRVTLDESGAEQPIDTTYQGLTTVALDPLRRKRTEQRDALGQLVAVTDALNGVTTLAYEPFGNLRKTVDPSGNVSEIVYDRLGRKTQLKDPDLGLITYTPDQFGRVLVQQGAEQRVRGERVDITYDALDRMTGRYERDMRAVWVYDTAANGKGALAETYTGSADKKDYRRVHAYDSLGRPTTVTLYQADGTYTNTTGYDAWGRLSTQTYQRGATPAKTFAHRYNGFGYLATVERGTLVLWRATAADAAGRVTSLSFGNGLVQTRTYSASSTRLTGGQLIGAGGQLRLDEGYQYDPIGNVTGRSQQWAGHGFFETFGYDDLNRLKSSTIGADAKSITYYPDGRIRTKTGVGTGEYAYPTAGAGSVRPHAVSSIPGIGNFAYDNSGNLLNGAGRTVTWTSFDMPLTITKGASSSTFRYGSEYQRARQDRGDGTTIIYADGQEVETTGGQVTVKTYWPNGIGVEIDRPGKPTELNWTHTDRLGSPVAISDEAGNLREELAYDPWGKRRDTANNATPDTVDGKTDNKGFTNHEMLDQLDLVHMNGRIYDPLIGRFMSGDPLVQDPANGQNYNRYSYVLNNPTNVTDPTGFACVIVTGSNIPTCNNGDDDKVLNLPGGAKELLKGNGKGKTLEKALKETSAGTGKQDAKNPGQTSTNNTTGTPSGCRTSVDCSGKGNGYDKNDPNYHKYTIDTPICTTGIPGCTVQSVDRSVKKNAAPGSDGVTSLKDGDKTSIVFVGISGGHVTHIVDDANSRVVNITDSDHVFYNGLVIRSVVSQGGVISVSSYGEGVNKPASSWMPDALSKAVNLVTAYPGFKMLDGKIQRDVLKQSSQGQNILQRQEIKRLESGYHGQ
jgi:RHS repeat-associated protein